jgi:hypothetical protein
MVFQLFLRARNTSMVGIVPPFSVLSKRAHQISGEK